MLEMSSKQETLTRKIKGDYESQLAQAADELSEKESALEQKVRVAYTEKRIRGHGERTGQGKEEEDGDRDKDNGTGERASGVQGGEGVPGEEGFNDAVGAVECEGEAKEGGRG